MGWVEDIFDDPIYDIEYKWVLENTEKAKREVEFICRETGLRESDRVLDLACGHGRHVPFMAARVKAVLGYDRTERFIECARQRAKDAGILNAEFVVGDMRDLPYEAEFDGVYNYFSSWGYYSHDENVDVLVRVHRALKPGGRFLMEATGRDALVRRYRESEWGKWPDGTVQLIRRRFDVVKGRHVETRTYMFPDGRGEKTVEIDRQVPSPDALIGLFQTVGFKDIRVVSAPGGEEISMDTFMIAIIGTRES